MNTGYWGKSILYSMKGRWHLNYACYIKEETIIIFNKVSALSAKNCFKTTRIRATAYAPGKVDRYLSVHNVRPLEYIASANSCPWTKRKPD